MAGEAPFWQIDAQQPQQPLTLSLLQERQPPSNFAQAQVTYNKMWMDGRIEADKKIAARRDALKVDGMPPVISGSCCTSPDTAWLRMLGIYLELKRFLVELQTWNS
jgi:hypothetical protein